MDLYKDLSIFIPTYRRVAAVKTLKALSPGALQAVSLVVRQEERDAYKSAHPEVRVLTLPIETSNLSQTRNWILKNCAARYCMMLDDDLSFSYRPDLSKWSLKGFADPTMFDAMVVKMLSRMRAERIAHCAISPVEGHSHYIAEWNYLQRYMRAYIFDMEVLKNFMYADEVNGCEDFDMALQLVSRGYPSLVCYAYAQTHAGSNARGGLSEYRDIAYHNRAMEQLKLRWPKHVCLVKKKTKHSWGGLPRVDVRVAWKKLFEESTPGWHCKTGDNTNTPRRIEEPVSQ